MRLFPRFRTCLPAALLALAACGNSSLSGLPGKAGMLPPPSFTLSGCTNFGGNFAVPTASARAALPPGFEPVATTGGSNAGAVLYVLGLRCTDSVVDGIAQGEARLLYAELAAVPDADHAVEGISDYTVPLFFVAEPAALGEAAALHQLGEAGTGSVSWADLTPAGGIEVQATLGDASVTLSGYMPEAAPGSVLAGQFVIFGVQDAELRSRLKGISSPGLSYQGPVTLQVSGGPAILAEARPLARGFSVTDFQLGFESLP